MVSSESVRSYLDQFSNLYPVGRNGMHRYNNQDHSMLAANAAVNAIIDHGYGKAKIWSINAEQDYHEVIDTRGLGCARSTDTELAPQRHEA